MPRKTRTIEEVKTLFELFECTVLTTEFKNVDQKLDVVCKQGHHYKTAITNLLRQGKLKSSGCRQCGLESSSRKQRLDFSIVKELFESNGYQLLSTSSYKNSKSKLDYICPKGHSGSISYINFYRGNRCQTCYEIKRKGELKTHDDIYQSSFYQRRVYPYICV